MRNYLKILLITLTIQLGFDTCGTLLSELLETTGNISDISLVCSLVGVPISIVVDIVLSIKWGKTLKEKLLCIFLMPTNYIWILEVCYAIWLLNQWLDIISNLPPNFG